MAARRPKASPAGPVVPAAASTALQVQSSDQRPSSRGEAVGAASAGVQRSSAAIAASASLRAALEPSGRGLRQAKVDEAGSAGRTSLHFRDCSEQRLARGFGVRWQGVGAARSRRRPGARLHAPAARSPAGKRERARLCREAALAHATHGGDEASHAAREVAQSTGRAPCDEFGTGACVGKPCAINASTAATIPQQHGARRVILRIMHRRLALLRRSARQSRSDRGVCGADDALRTSSCASLSAPCATSTAAASAWPYCAA